jgi:hypothetical protein
LTAYIFGLCALDSSERPVNKPSWLFISMHPLDHVFS